MDASVNMLKKWWLSTHGWVKYGHAQNVYILPSYNQLIEGIVQQIINNIIY